jgi:acetyl esterase/lipase
MSSRLKRGHRLLVESLERRDLLSVAAFDATPSSLIEVNSTATVTEDQPAVNISPAAVFSAPPEVQLNNAVLTISVTDGAVRGDNLNVRNEGNGLGQLSTFDSRILIYNGEAFGSYSATPAPDGVPYVYKTVNGRELKLQVFSPTEASTEPRPAVLLYHGGGWKSGSPQDLTSYARYYASRGMVAALVEYRFADPGTLEAPVDSIQDAKSAVRWIRGHADELEIDPNRIATAGASAGGHLAAFTGMVEGLDDPQDDLGISAKANAVILFSAVVNNGPDQFGYDRVGAQYPQFSPAHNVSVDDPPTIAFVGTDDPIVPEEIYYDLRDQMAAAGVRLDLHVYEGQGHTLSSTAWNNPYFYEVLTETDRFLASLGWLSGEATAVMPDSPPATPPLSQIKIELGSHASPEAVQALLRNITFRSAHADSSNSEKTIVYQFLDGQGTFSDLDTQSLSVQLINDAPVLKGNADLSLGTIPEDTADPPGVSVASLLAGNATDSDTDALSGIAIVAADGLSNGAWQYSSDGGTSWTNMGQPTYSEALLLPAESLLRFVPAKNFAETVSLRYRAWDQTQGAAYTPFNLNTITLAGSSAFSAGVQTVPLTIEPVNNAPILKANTDLSLGAIPEDVTNPPGVSVASLLAGNVTDYDTGALSGIAIVAADGLSHGAWQYSSDTGTNWTNMGQPTYGQALLLPAEALLRFVPAKNFAGTVSLRYRAWDQTQGAAYTSFNLNTITLAGSSAFSAGVQTVPLTTEPVNDAPVLKGNAELSLGSIPEDTITPPGVNVASLLAGNVSDSDTDALSGIAIVATDGLSHGTWQYSSNGETSWTNMGQPTYSEALLLPAEALLRFVPAKNFAGTVSLRYRAWDQTQGTPYKPFNLNTITLGGSGAFSGGVQTVPLVVQPVNDAPVLKGNADLSLGTIPEDAANPPGVSVASLLAGNATDSDTDALSGIAIVAADELSQGAWQYSSNGGTSWTNMGTVHYAQALLLPAEALLRFVPAKNFAGTVSLRYRAWDQTQGTPYKPFNLNTITLGGSSAFSGGVQTVPLVVQPINDAPNIVGTSPNIGYTLNSPAILLASTAAVKDPDTVSFTAGFLKVEIVGGADAGDRLTIGGPFKVVQGRLLWNGTTDMGWIQTGGEPGNSLLVIHFNENATRYRVEQLVRSLKYGTIASQAKGTRVIELSVSDGTNVGDVVRLNVQVS